MIGRRDREREREREGSKEMLSLSSMINPATICICCCNLHPTLSLHTHTHTHTQTQVASEQSSASREVHGPRLVQEAEFHLYGNIESLDSVELPHSSRSTLVLSFREAKVTEGGREGGWESTSSL